MFDDSDKPMREVEIEVDKDVYDLLIDLKENDETISDVIKRIRSNSKNRYYEAFKKLKNLNIIKY